jgi:hypothetical protein
MIQLLSSLWVTHAIGTLARLGLADAMEAGADNAEAIAKPHGLVTDRVYRLLRALSTCGIVTESAGGRFALTPLGRMLTSKAPNSMRTSAELLTEYNGEIWGHLDGALEGGIAFEALKGKPLFNWLHANPKEGARFQRHRRGGPARDRRGACPDCRPAARPRAGRRLRRHLCPGRRPRLSRGRSALCRLTGRLT